MFTQEELKTILRAASATLSDRNSEQARACAQGLSAEGCMNLRTKLVSMLSSDAMMAPFEARNMSLAEETVVSIYTSQCPKDRSFNEIVYDLENRRGSAIQIREEFDEIPLKTLIADMEADIDTLEHLWEQRGFLSL